MKTGKTRNYVFLVGLFLIHCLLNAQTRDPWLQPFLSTSIWNMPIGSDAVYAPVTLVPTRGVGIDAKHFAIQDLSYPEIEVKGFDNFAPANGRCSATGDMNGLTVRIPDDFLVHDVFVNGVYGTKPNASFVFLNLDKQTSWNGPSIARCEIGGPLYMRSFQKYPDNRVKDNLFGDGVTNTGGQGASKMSGIGGTLRKVDFQRPGPVRHVIKINPWGAKLFYSEAIKGFKWPATAADEYANKPHKNRYVGADPNLVMGALLAIRPNVTAEQLGLTTQAGRDFLFTLQNYGAYICEDAGWDVFDFVVEAGAEYEFQKKYGISMKSSIWKEEVLKLAAVLHTITNNTPATIGGGGNPLQPMACPLGVVGSGEMCPGPPSAPVESVSISNCPISSLMTNGEIKLTVDILPWEATNKNVSWNSSNTAVAEVDNHGVVSAISEGTAIITVTTEEGGFSDQCAIVVKNWFETPAIYSEDFNDNLAQGWSPNPAENWSLADGKYKTVKGGLWTSIYNDQKFKNYTFMADAYPNFHNDFGVIFNYVDALNYYVIILDADPKTARLVRVENGISSAVGSTKTYTNGGFQQINSFIINHNTDEVSIMINGAQIFDKIYIVPADSTKIGLWVERNPVDFDNVNVYRNIVSNDTIPPTMPTELVVSNITETSVELSWTASTDSAGIALYHILNNSELLALSVENTLTLTNLNCNTAYNFSVVALDVNGLVSDTSGIVVSSTLVCDEIPPTALTGLEASDITENSVSLTWYESTDNKSVTGYNVYVDGSLDNQYVSNSGIVSGLGCNTSYTITVLAKDEAGNLSDADTIEIKTAECIDEEPPTAPENVTASNITESELQLHWNASEDNIGVTGYDVLVDGVLFGSATDTTIVITGLSCNTSYGFKVKAKDEAGNFSPESVSYTASTASCIINSIAGRNEIQDQIQIYPQHVNNELYIRMIGIKEFITIEIYNTAGILKHKETTSYGNNHIINLHHIPSGTYIARFLLTNQVINMPIIKL